MSHDIAAARSSLKEARFKVQIARHELGKAVKELERLIYRKDLPASLRKQA